MLLCIGRLADARLKGDLLGKAVRCLADTASAGVVGHGDRQKCWLTLVRRKRTLVSPRRSAESGCQDSASSAPDIIVEAAGSASSSD